VSSLTSEVLRCSQKATEDINWPANAEVFEVMRYSFIHSNSHGKRRNEIRYKEEKQQGREERTEVLFVDFLEEEERKQKRRDFSLSVCHQH